MIFHYKAIFKSLSELGMVTIKFEDINKDFILLRGLLSKKENPK